MGKSTKKIKTIFCFIFIIQIIILAIVGFTPAKTFAFHNGSAASIGTVCLRAYAVSGNKITAMNDLNKAVYFILNASVRFPGAEVSPLSFNIRIIGKNKKDYFLAEQYISVNSQSMADFVVGRLKNSIEVTDYPLCEKSRNAIAASAKAYERKEKSAVKNREKSSNIINGDIFVTLGLGYYPYPYYPYGFYYPFYSPFYYPFYPYYPY